MSLDSALMRATSGLRHVSRQIDMTSQNVSNAATEGYTRKVVRGEQVIGGVKSTAPQRDIDRSMRTEARSARGEKAAFALRADTLAPLAQLQGVPTDGQSLAGLLGTLRDDMTSLRANPADTAAQAEALRGADQVSSRMQEIAGAVTRSRQSVQDGLRTDVDAANALLRDIAGYDAAARLARAAGSDNTGMLDQRDAAVGQLAELVDVTPVDGQDGSLTLIMRGGAVLPLDPKGSPLGIADAVVSPGAYHGAPDGTLPGLTLNGMALADVPRGGRIGEGLALRDETLARMGAELDTLATALAGRLSEQGLTLFTEAGGATPPALGSAASVGFASRIVTNPEVQANAALLRDGTADVAAFPPNPEGQSGYTALLDRVINNAFGSQKAAGVDHTPIPGGGLGPSGQLASTFSPPRRVVDYAAAMTATQAAEAGAADERAVATGSLSTQLDALVQRREGVDVDSEMAAMVTLQNAYAANARIVSALQSMWDALMNAVH